MDMVGMSGLHARRITFFPRKTRIKGIPCLVSNVRLAKAQGEKDGPTYAPIWMHVTSC